MYEHKLIKELVRGKVADILSVEKHTLCSKSHVTIFCNMFWCDDYHWLFKSAKSTMDIEKTIWFKFKLLLHKIGFIKSIPSPRLLLLLDERFKYKTTPQCYLTDMVLCGDISKIKQHIQHAILHLVPSFGQSVLFNEEHKLIKSRASDYVQTLYIVVKDDVVTIVELELSYVALTDAYVLKKTNIKYT